MTIQDRVIKFRAFCDFGHFKMMLDEVTVHAATNMIGIHHEAFVEILESTDWKINDEYQFENENTEETIDHDKVKVYDSGEDYYFIEDTKVMQFTGLHDKEGKEIYEGDICKTYEIGVGNLKRVVEFDSGSFVFTHPFCLTSEIRGWKKDFIEVIGNVHQNPELLTK
jgi:uncharacterized phage protein (TIGR01671 family)